MAVDVEMMETKKTQTQQVPKAVNTAPTETVVQTTQWRNSLGDIKDEFKKISWTSPDELRAYTKIVVGMTLLFGMGIYFIDVIIQTVLSGLNIIMRLIGG